MTDVGTGTGLLVRCERAEAEVERLRAALIERAEHWASDARDADFAGNSYKGHDDDAAVDLFCQAARSRSRALELRSLVALAGSSVVTEEEKP